MSGNFGSVAGSRARVRICARKQWTIHRWLKSSSSYQRFINRVLRFAGGSVRAQVQCLLHRVRRSLQFSPYGTGLTWQTQPEIAESGLRVAKPVEQLGNSAGCLPSLKAALTMERIPAL